MTLFSHPRYWLEASAWAVAWILVLVVILRLELLLAEGSPWRWVLLCAIAPPVMAGLWVELRQIRRMDELQRQIYLEAQLCAVFALVLTFVFAYMAEVLVHTPRWNPVLFLLVYLGAFLVGWWRASRRYA
jgi:hypothetical protein